MTTFFHGHVNGLSHGFGVSENGFLEYFTAHAGSHDTVPLISGHGACAHCLGQHIHGIAGLLGIRAGHSRQVGDTLNGRNRSIQIDTGRGESADTLGHLCEIVDSLIGVMVQRVQPVIDSLDTF